MHGNYGNQTIIICSCTMESIIRFYQTIYSLWQFLFVDQNEILGNNNSMENYNSPLFLLSKYLFVWYIYEISVELSLCIFIFFVSFHRSLGSRSLPKRKKWFNNEMKKTTLYIFIKSLKIIQIQGDTSNFSLLSSKLSFLIQP